MTTRQFLDFLHARPFQQFTVTLSDGRDFVISHPEFVATSQGPRIFTVTTSDGSEEAFDLLHVVSLRRTPER